MEVIESLCKKIRKEEGIKKAMTRRNPLSPCLAEKSMYVYLLHRELNLLLKVYRSKNKRR